MRLISFKKLRDFFGQPKNVRAERPMRAWRQVVRKAEWRSFADVKETYRSADQVGNKVVFNVGGNKYRIVVVIDYEAHIVYVRFVLSHKDYNKGHWKKDPFGKDWKPRASAKGDNSYDQANPAT
jgi:mRNA interferase HigB